MEVIALAPEPTLALVLFVLENSDSLPKVAADVLDPALALAIVHNHFQANFFIGKVQDFVNICLNLHVVVRFKATEASSVLHVPFEIELL